MEREYSISESESEDMDMDVFEYDVDSDYDPSLKEDRRKRIPDYFNIRNKKALLKEIAEPDFENFDNTDTDKDDEASSREASSSASSSQSILAVCKPNPFAYIFDKYSYLDGTFYKILAVDDKKIKTQCQLCLPKYHIINGIISVSTNFLKHMKKIHPASLKQFKNYILQNKMKAKGNKRRSSGGIISRSQNSRTTLQQSITTSLSKLPFVSQGEFDNRVLKFLVNSMSPLSILDNIYFINIFAGLNVSVITRKMAVKKIRDLNYQQLQSIKNQLFETEFVCTTTDIWSSKKRSFLGVTCHWLDNSLTRHSVALACKRFGGAHTHDRIAENLDEIYSNFGLTNKKIVATVTDNGSNFVKCFAEFGVKLYFAPSQSNEPDEEEMLAHSEERTIEAANEEIAAHEEIDTDEDMPVFVELVKENKNVELPNHKRCASHSLSLIAVTDINNAIQKNTLARSRHTAILHKCSTLWKKCSYPKSAEIVKNCLGRYLSQPGITRWNSMYDSMKQILDNSEKLNELFQKLELKMSFKETEIRYLQNYCKILEPLASALDILQGENNCYYGYLLPCMVSLKVKLNKLQKDENYKSEPAFTILNACINSLHRRFSEFINVTEDVDDAILATFSIPQFKLRWYGGIKDTAARDLELIKKMIATTAAEMVNFEESIAVESGPLETDTFFDFESNENETTTTQNNSQNQQQESHGALKGIDVSNLEILRYLEDHRTDLNVLDDYPTIKKLFLKYNTPVPSSAPVERMFSFASIINAPKRHALSDTNFEHLVLLKANANF